ncbi:MAG TPA: DUF302 domain-containing protein [Gemmatimonadaceae bacterium]|jgi:uncharacterized protein (DUF302 family)|nr:DUF302 domain-containing protein [Gemmatimonadaceae bacterium]
MIRKNTRYGLWVSVRKPYEETVERTKQALAQEGFGVLTEIDVRATLKKKLDVEFRPYVILGACNPTYAFQALNAERDIGLLLPCNVIVYASDAAGATIVAALDPVEAMKVAGNDNLRPIAEDVRAHLERALSDIEAG